MNCHGASLNKISDSRLLIGYPGPNQLKDIASLHRLCFPESMFSIAGDQMALAMYQFMHAHPAGLLLIAQIRDEIIGFVAGSFSRDRFWKQFCVLNAHRLIFYMLPKAIGQKHLWKILLTRLLAVGKIPEAGKTGWKIDKIPEASLMSIAVKPTFRNKGIGQKLNAAFLNELGKRNCMTVKLGVSASNTQAVQSYLNSGWEIAFDNGCNLIMTATLPKINGEKPNVTGN